MLTDAEQNLVQRTFAQGPAALSEQGYSEPEQEEFLAREDVRAHLLLLEREMDHSEALQLRQRRITQRSLGKLSNGAVAVLGQALAGPEYLFIEDPKQKGHKIVQRGAGGRPIIGRPEPTPIQLKAAEVILEVQGVQQQKAKNESAIGADVSVEVLFKGDVEAAVEIADDPEHVKESQRALSREKVRTAIQILANKVPALHINLRRNLGLPVPEEIRDAEVTVRTPRKKAKAAKKKVVKKATKKKTATKKTSGRKKKKAPSKR